MTTTTNLKGQFCVYFSIVFLLLATIVYGQENQVQLPVSPNAASLGEYGNTPISLANGTPNISIPIVEIKGSQLSLPISLSYRASGIKVEEVSSHVGLGWSLNAGGVISRAVAGKADLGVNSEGLYPGKQASPSLSIPLENSVDAYKLAGCDTEPDTYFYSFLGYSGKFVFDFDGSYVVAPDQNFKVEFPYPAADLTITDDYGNKYYFTHKESSRGIDQGIYSPTQAVTAWYLSKIESADGTETIEFTYINESYLTYIPEREVYWNAVVIGNKGDRTETSALRLKSITTNFGYSVNFLSTLPRQDFPSGSNAYAITGMEVYGPNGLVKTVAFDQEYVESQYLIRSDPTYYSTDVFQGNINWANFRLYLKSVTIKGKSSSGSQNQEVNYRFSYNGRNSVGKDLLPHRLSFAQDHWGYYNGATGNRTLRPTYGNVAGANRTSSYPACEAGTIKSITYPTGGVTEFFYGPHRDGTKVYGGVRIERIKDLDRANGSILKEKIFEYSPASLAGYPDYPDYVLGGPVYYNEGYFHKEPISNCSPQNGQNCISMVRIRSGHPFTLGTTNGYHVNYQWVTERELGNGYTVYYYSDVANEDIVERSENWLYTPEKDYSWMRGLLRFQDVYDENDVLVKSVTNDYGDYNHLKTINAIKYTKTNITSPLISNNEWFYNNYIIKLGAPKVKTQTIVENGVTTVINNEYDASHYLHKITETNSDGRSIVTYNYYPQSALFANSSTNGASLLRSRNMYARVLRTTKVVNGTQVYNKNYIYSTVNNNAVLVGIKEEPAGQASGENEQQISYNINTRPVSKSIMNGTTKLETSSYIWSYNNTLPIAEVKNASENQIAYTSFEEDGKGNWSYNTSGIITTEGRTGVSSYSGTVSKAGLPVGKYIVSLWAKGSGTISVNGSSKSISSVWKLYEWELNNVSSVTISSGSNKIDEVRLFPSNAQMTTYTYEPLVGISSSTDARGETSFYEYDNFNRLSVVKDHNGHILQQYSYNYADE